MAFVNVLVHGSREAESRWAQPVDHLLMWHNALLGQRLRFAEELATRSPSAEPSMTNLSVRNNIFERLEGRPLPTEASFANGDLVPGFFNNHFVGGRFYGIDATIGDPGFAAPEIGDFRPSPDSILLRRDHNPPLAADVEGSSLDSPAPIGPIATPARRTGGTDNRQWPNRISGGD